MQMVMRGAGHVGRVFALFETSRVRNLCGAFIRVVDHCTLHDGRSGRKRMGFVGASRWPQGETEQVHIITRQRSGPDSLQSSPTRD